VIEVIRNIRISGKIPTSGPPARSKVPVCAERALHERQQDAGNDDHQRDRPGIPAKLEHHPKGDRERDAGAHPDPSSPDGRSPL
jgi:hypothetical protein